MLGQHLEQGLDSKLEQSPDSKGGPGRQHLDWVRDALLVDVSIGARQEDSQPSPRNQPEAPPIRKPGAGDLRQIKEQFGELKVGAAFASGANGAALDVSTTKAGPDGVPRKLAFKVVPEYLRDDEFTAEDLISEFYQEAKTYAEIGEHSNIVRCHGMVTIDGLEGLLMDKVEGGTLDGLFRNLNTLRDSNQLGHSEFWGVMQHLLRGTLNGLAYMQTKGFAHNDIKGDNVMFDRASCEAKLIDVGMVTRHGANAKGGATSYKAPEKRAAKSLDDGTSDLASSPEQDSFSVGQMIHAKIEGSFFTNQNSSPFAQFTNVVRPEASGEDANKNGKYALETAYVNFLNLLMHPNPDERLSPIDALEHPFIKDSLLSPDEAVKTFKKAGLNQSADATLSEAKELLESYPNAALADQVEETKRMATEVKKKESEGDFTGKQLERTALFQRLETLQSKADELTELTGKYAEMSSRLQKLKLTETNNDDTVKRADTLEKIEALVGALAKARASSEDLRKALLELFGELQRAAGGGATVGRIIGADAWEKAWNAWITTSETLTREHARASGLVSFQSLKNDAEQLRQEYSSSDKAAPRTPELAEITTKLDEVRLECDWLDAAEAFDREYKFFAKRFGDDEGFKALQVSAANNRKTALARGAYDQARGEVLALSIALGETVDKLTKARDEERRGSKRESVANFGAFVKRITDSLVHVAAPLLDDQQLEQAKELAAGSTFGDVLGAYKAYDDMRSRLQSGDQPILVKLASDLKEVSARYLEQHKKPMTSDGKRRNASCNVIVSRVDDLLRVISEADASCLNLSRNFSRSAPELLNAKVIDDLRNVAQHPFISPETKSQAELAIAQQRNAMKQWIKETFEEERASPVRQAELIEELGIGDLLDD